MTIDPNKILEAMAEEMADDHVKLAEQHERIQSLEAQNTALLERVCDLMEAGGDAQELRLKVLELENESAVSQMLIDGSFTSAEAIYTLISVNAQMYARAAVSISDPEALGEIWALSRLTGKSVDA